VKFWWVNLAKPDGQVKRVIQAGEMKIHDTPLNLYR
jgi:hypothetical protein